MMSPDKPKKKKPSLSTQIKRLRIDRDSWYDYYLETRGKLDKLRGELSFVKKTFPMNYYKIEFKIKSNDGVIVPCEEIHQGINVEHAIHCCKNTKTHPNTFELIDIKLMGI